MLLETRMGLARRAQAMTQDALTTHLLQTQQKILRGIIRGVNDVLFEQFAFQLFYRAFDGRH